ncbi:hypothetical protein ACKC9G_17525 [Pokkaliibacter sp. CJK22405]|uniref:hypothetical protein n=1 Tax=Pokkaliibacter sp. CJK22405 TaxID=3384615 RepID=UPI003984FB6A
MRTKLLLSAVAAATLLAGCQANQPKTVAPEGRDLAHTYDGTWKGQAWAQTRTHFAHVMSSRAQIYCPGFSDQIELNVKDGWVTGTLRPSDPITFKTPVSPGGYFYAEAPVKGGSWFIDGSLPIFTSERKVVFTGVFNPASGLINGQMKTTPKDETIGCAAQFRAAQNSAMIGAPTDLPGYTGSAKFDEVGGQNSIFLD